MEYGVAKVCHQFPHSG